MTTTRVPSTKEVLAQQARDAAAFQQRTAVVPAAAPQLPAIPDERSAIDRYLDEQAPGGLVGRRIKWSKEGEYELPDTGDTLGEEDDYVALCDQTLAGYVRFNGKGNPPDVAMGLLYDGFIPPPRISLGNTDEAEWEMGLDGKPADPWQQHMYLVLQNAASLEMFTFDTSSKTGRRAVGNLLKHFNRMPGGFYPVIRLKKGGFQHRDDRVGWVATPAFAVVGKAPKDGSPTPPNTSVGADLDDSLADIYARKA